MPWWAILYASFYFLLTVVGDLFMFKERTSTGYWLAESIAHFGTGILLLGCWLDIVPQSLGWFAVLFFVFAILWEIVTGIGDARKTLAEEKSSGMAKAFDFILPVFLIGPAYVGAAYTAFRAVT